MTSSEKQPEPNTQLIQQLAANLQGTSALIQGLLRSIQDNALTLAAFEGEITGLQRTVSSLNRVLQEGDGKASILTRVALLENQVEALTKDLQGYIGAQKTRAERARRDSAALVKQQLDSKLKVRLSKMQVATVIVPSVLAFIISILTLVLK